MSINQIKIRQSNFFDSSILTLLIVGMVAGTLAYFIFHCSIITMLSVMAILLFGVQLPRLVGRKTRIKRSLESKEKERDKWGFHSRDREGPWINYIDYPLIKESKYADGKCFYSEWLIIKDGKIVVNPGTSTVDTESGVVKYDYSVRRTYAWDGCTPKRFFLWFAILGTPDWWQVVEIITTLDDHNKVVQKSVLWQQAHHASLVHDALYQYLDIIPISKKDVDQQFYDMLVNSHMPELLAKIYHLFVHLFGARGIKNNNLRNSTFNAVSVP